MDSNEFWNKIILFLGICIVGLIILLIQTFSDLKSYADILITFISIVASILAIIDFLKKISKK